MIVLSSVYANIFVLLRVLPPAHFSLSIYLRLFSFFLPPPPLEMYGKEVGHLNVVFDNNGEIKAYDGSAVMLRTYPSPVGCSGADCHKLDNGTVTAEGGFGTVQGVFPFDTTS